MIVSRQLYSPLRSPVQKRFLEFYQTSVASKISGYFDGVFWSRLILQLSHLEPCINHAITALSSMYEQFETSSNSSPPYSAKGDEPTLESYNAAIKSLSVKMNSNTQSVTVPLVACLLFICLEFMRRDIDAAMRHIHSGCAILQTRTQRLNQGWRMPRSNRDPDSPSGEVIEEIVVAIFERLCMLSGLFFRPVSPGQTHSTETANEDQLMRAYFSDFSEARNALNVRIAPALDFVRVTCEVKYDPVAVARYHEKQNTLIASLNQWRWAFEDWFSKRGKLTKDEIVAANLLRLQHGASHIHLSTCLNVKESAFDDYTDNFNELVNLAASVLAANEDSQEHKSSFSFEMVTIPPLFLVSVKCRHPITRRRAISLLLSSPRREGLWDAYRAGRVAERILIHEEKGPYLESIPRYRDAAVRSYTTSELPQLTLKGEAKTRTECLSLFEEGHIDPFADCPAYSPLRKSLEGPHAHDFCDINYYQQLVGDNIPNTTAISSASKPRKAVQNKVALTSLQQIGQLGRGYDHRNSDVSDSCIDASAGRLPLVSSHVPSTAHCLTLHPFSLVPTGDPILFLPVVGERQSASRIRHAMPREMPDEASRLHENRVAHEAPPARETVLPVTFKWKPYGLDGAWHVWGEVIHL